MVITDQSLVLSRSLALSVLKSVPVGISSGKINQVYALRIRDDFQKNLKNTTEIHWSEGYLGLAPQTAPEQLKMTSVAQRWSISYHGTSLCEKSEEHHLERKITNGTPDGTQEPDPGHPSHKMSQLTVWVEREQLSPRALFLQKSNAAETMKLLALLCIDTQQVES